MSVKQCEEENKMRNSYKPRPRGEIEWVKKFFFWRGQKFWSLEIEYFYHFLFEGRVFFHFIIADFKKIERLVRKWGLKLLRRGQLFIF